MQISCTQRTERDRGMEHVGWVVYSLFRAATAAVFGVYVEL